ncbi:unnamed protein product, partial [Brugia timori]|uniref:NET domain-containing protein n=1 Tax=Brugia timori TaxID=42155 RepID=A0A0R3QG27_9BILA
MVPSKLENATPTVYSTKSRVKKLSDSELNPNIIDPIDAQEIFDYIRSCCSRDINDPEHPLTLEQLNVVQEELIVVDKDNDEMIVNVIMRFLL